MGPDGCQYDRRLLIGRTAGVCLSEGNLELLTYRPLALACQRARAWSSLMILKYLTNFHEIRHKHHVRRERSLSALRISYNKQYQNGGDANLLCWSDTSAILM
jgi:hypothetical protein